MSIRVRGLELDRSLIFSDGFVQLFLFRQRAAEIAKSFCVIRLKS